MEGAFVPRSLGPDPATGTIVSFSVPERVPKSPSMSTAIGLLGVNDDRSKAVNGRGPEVEWVGGGGGGEVSIIA